MLRGHRGGITALRALESEGVLLSAGADGWLRTWRRRSAEGAPEPPYQHGPAIICLDVSAADSLVAIGGADGKIAVWSRSERRIVAEFDCAATVTDVAFDETAEFIAAAVGGGLRIWAIADRHEVLRHRTVQQIEKVCWTPGQLAVVITGVDGTNILDLYAPRLRGWSH